MKIVTKIVTKIVLYISLTLTLLLTALAGPYQVVEPPEIVYIPDIAPPALTPPVLKYNSTPPPTLRTDLKTSGSRSETTQMKEVITVKAVPTDNSRDTTVNVSINFNPTMTMTGPMNTNSMSVTANPVQSNSQTSSVSQGVHGPASPGIIPFLKPQVRPVPSRAVPVCPTPSCTSTRRTVRIPCPPSRTQYVTRQVSPPAPVPVAYQQPYYQEAPRSRGIIGGFLGSLFGGASCGSSYGGAHPSYYNNQRPSPYSSRGYLPQPQAQRSMGYAPQHPPVQRRQQAGPGNSWDWRNQPTPPYYKTHPNGQPNPNHRDNRRRY